MWSAPSRFWVVVLIGAVAVGWPSPGRAASGRLFHAHWGTEDGLPQSSVLSIARDADGAVWVGTQDGVSRFDGRVFRTFTQEAGLPCPLILALATDDRGRVLVGTDGCGAFRMVGDHAERLAGVPTDGRVKAMVVSPDGTVWVATDTGLVRLAPDGSRALLCQEPVLALALGRPGEVYLAVHGKVGLVGGGALRWLSELPIPSAELSALALLDDALWIGTRDAGVLRAQLSHPEAALRIEGLPSPEVTALAHLDDGALWAATTGGVARYDGARFVPLAVDAAPRNATALASAGDLIFLGDANTGLHLLRPTRIDHLGAAEGLTDPVVWSVHQDARGEIWSGAEHGSLGRWVQGRFIPLPATSGLPAASVYSILDGPDGTLWAGTSAGLFHWDGARGELFTTAGGLPSVAVHTVRFDAHGALWACTDLGLARRLPGKRFEDMGPVLGLPRTACLSLAFEADGSFWVGGPDVLGRVEHGHFTPLATPGRPDVLSIHPGAHGELWIAGNRGLGRVLQGKVDWIGGDRGLLDHQLLSVAEVGDHLWITSDRGPFRLARSEVDAFFEGKITSVESVPFGVGDGMAHAECNAYSDDGLLVARDGHLWIPTMNGLAVLDPAALARPPLAPVPVIDQVFDHRRQPLGSGAHRVLGPETRNVEITYGAAEFHHAQQLMFRYQLVGNDSRWVEAGTRRSAWYTNLKPGTYTLLVQARLPGGPWSASAAPLTLELRPLLWERWSFRLGLLLAVGLGLALLLRMRWAALRRHEAELQQRVDERTADLAAALARAAQGEASSRALIERLPLGLLVEQGERVVFANPEFLRLTGARDVDDLNSAPLERFIHPDERALFGFRHRLLARGKPNVPREARMVRLDGSEVQAQIWGFPMDFEGAPSAIILAMDLTEVRALRAKLMAVEHMASLGTLAAGVAHEINNPLAYVLSNLSFLSEELAAMVASAPGSDWTEVREALDEARQGAQRVKRIVSDLKTFSRPTEAGNGAFDPGPVIASTLNLARTEIRHRAELETSLAELPLVYGDAHRVGQVLLNLLVNAAQAIPEGKEETQRVWLHSEVAPDGRVMIEVGDTGCGIPAANLKRIFDPFFTTKPAGVGTGLGLSICHGILQACGGEITVESEVGKGSRFRVWLQRAADPGSASAGQAPSSPAPPEVATSR